MKNVVCGLDIETTGLNPSEDTVLELAYVIKEWESPRFLKAESLYIKGDHSEAGIKATHHIHGITKELVDTGFMTLRHAIGCMILDCIKYGVQAFVAHNGRNFDIPFILENLRQQEEAVEFKNPIIDSKEDVKYPEMFKQRDLISLAALHGFLNPFPHNALSDVFTMMKVVQPYSFEETFAYAQEPDVLLVADVGFHNKDKAKAARYMWQSAGKFNVPGKWVKLVKQSKVEFEMTTHPFRVYIQDQGKLL